ncbi:MATE family efflux transporter DinF [Klebsiella pneumoniae]|uniref:MATE family efflux transporter DinF n=1 Tax=Klebsiella pneumoniae TaxID=573 RepID=UPI0035584605
MLLNAADKALWRLALPMIFSNITVPLLGLVDTAVIGHLDSPVYLGGVAVGATATSFLFMLLLFLRMSTTGLTAQAWGAKDPQRLARALVQPLALALGAGVLTLRGVSLAMLKNAWRGDLRRLLALNRDIMLRSLLLQLCFGALTVFGARLGSDIVAVNAVLMTMLTFTAYALDGFAYAVEAHSGQAYGARDGSQLLEVWRAACRQSGMVALAFALIYSLAGQYIIALLTSLPSLQQLADRYLIWQTILPVVGVWCYLLDGMFIGATRGAEMRNSMAVAAAGFAVTLLTLPVLGNHGLWLALAVFLALRGLSLALIWRRHWRRGTWFS